MKPFYVYLRDYEPDGLGVESIEEKEKKSGCESGPDAGRTQYLEENQ